MSYKKWTLSVIGITALFLSLLIGFNFVMDPMWTFNHRTHYQNAQMAIDERQQKTNWLTFRPFHYDTLLLGSSRSTYIDQHKFKGFHTFNFAVSNMSVREYDSFVRYAKQQDQAKLQRVVIGLDFFKSSVNESTAPLSLDGNVVRANATFYRYKTLLSLDTFEYARKNFKAALKDKPIFERSYDNYNVASAVSYSDKVKQVRTKDKIKKFREVFYGPTYQYNDKYKAIIERVKVNNPDLEFIPFTTPISTELMQALVEEGRFDDYERWLRDVISVYGGVYNFMYPNTVTNNYKNYFDGHHFYPQVGDYIAERITDPTNKELPKDFGEYVTADTIDAHLKHVKELLNKQK
ncbi:hypothetical protein [Priestia koreensis]|uniref:hypothetical protein n=1 Tax=Priestia koreensis TaxID=284581 RepID=UPI001F592985|nr:hypothetical protein [Priestia koreensis]UNL84083.1 hypothetical protein IE339_18275 [Priestia koreensis]